MFNKTNKQRRKRYKELRSIRRERDYQTGALQYANRPISKKSSIRVVTTNDFINNTYRKKGVFKYESRNT